MQLSTLKRKTTRQHADAVGIDEGDTSSHEAKATGFAAYIALPKHSAFLPVMTIWSGLVLALVVLVLPDQAIARISSLTGVYLPLMTARLIFALGTGIFGGVLGFIISRALAHRLLVKQSDGILTSDLKRRDVEPIDPTADLGSDSLDAPIETADTHDEGELADFSEIQEDEEQAEPSLGDLARRGFRIEAPEVFEGQPQDQHKGGRALSGEESGHALVESHEISTCEEVTTPAVQAAVDDPQVIPEPQLTELEQADFAPLNADTISRKSDKPRALDLSEFAAMPGRDAVWVEKPAATTPEEINAKPPHAQVPESAIEKLRQTPTQELSLVEMIERFAAALHDRQSKERTSTSSEEVAREAALAEALKALALFTDAGFDKGNSAAVANCQIDQTEDELKNALARLQEVRGAA